MIHAFSRRSSVAILAAVLALAAAAAAMAGAFSDVGRSRSPAPPRTVAASALCALRGPQTVRIELPVAGHGRRSSLVHLPAHGAGGLPVLLALHGAYGNGAFMESYSKLSSLADREGFAVVYPDSAGPRWKIATGEGDSDVVFLTQLVNRLLADGCFAPKRVAVAGVSNGGGMAVRLACADAERLAAVVSVAGAYGTLPRCVARGPVSLLEIHGTADPVVPYRGGGKHAEDTDVLSFVNAWAARDGCRRTPVSRSVSPRVARLTWHRCRGGAQVEHVRLDGGTHAWPGTDGPDLGVSAADETWAFARDHRAAEG